MTDKTVVISLTKKKKIKVIPKNVEIDPANGDQVIWQADGGAIEVDFDKPEGKPFRSGNFTASDGNGTYSGTASVRPKNKKRYRYTAYLTLPTGATLKKDPGVDVDGSGPPGPRVKKVTRKKATRKSARKKAVKKVARKSVTRKKK